MVGFAFKMILPCGKKVRGAARSGAGRPAGGLLPWVQLQPQVGSLPREGHIPGRCLLQREQALLQAALQGDRRRCAALCPHELPRVTLIVDVGRGRGGTQKPWVEGEGKFGERLAHARLSFMPLHGSQW